METLDLNGAFEFNITGVYAGYSFDLELERYQDEDQTIPEPWVEAAWVFVVCEDGKYQYEKARVTPTIESNLMTIPFSSLLNSFQGGREYYFTLGYAVSGSVKKVEGKGKIIVSTAAQI